MGTFGHDGSAGTVLCGDLVKGTSFSSGGSGRITNLKLYLILVVIMLIIVFWFILRLIIVMLVRVRRRL